MKRDLWQTAPPAKDGAVIVAVGRVIAHDEFAITVLPFVAAVVWQIDSSGYEGWHYQGGLVLAQSLEDEVMIDWWAPWPKQEASN